MGPEGVARTITGRRVVQVKLRRALLLVEGKGTIPLPGQAEEVPAFDALAACPMMSGGGRYRFQAFTGPYSEDAQATLGDGRLEVNAPMGRALPHPRTDAGDGTRSAITRGTKEWAKPWKCRCASSPDPPWTAGSPVERLEGERGTRRHSLPP